MAGDAAPSLVGDKALVDGCSSESIVSCADELVSIGESPLAKKDSESASMDEKMFSVEWVNTSHSGIPAIEGNGWSSAMVAGDVMEPGKTVGESGNVEKSSIFP